MSGPDADRQLLSRCARGDEAALRRLVATHQRLIFGLAKRILGNAEDAEEVAASTFLNAWKGASSFRGDCSVRAYLCRIAVNLCRDRYSRIPAAPPCPPATAPDDRIERIHLAMRALTPEDREVIVLYYLDEMEYQEISDVLGVSYDVLKTRLTRARKRLRLILEIEP